MSESISRCSVCHNASAGEINEALVRGEPERKVGHRFCIPKSSIHDHKGHLSRALVKAANAAAVAQGDTLLAKVLDVEREVRRLATKAERSGDVRAALGGMRELTRIAELLGRLSGELRSRQIGVVSHLEQLTDEELERKLAELERAHISGLPLDELDRWIVELQDIRAARANEVPPVRLALLRPTAREAAVIDVEPCDAPRKAREIRTSIGAGEGPPGSLEEEESSSARPPGGW